MAGTLYVMGIGGNCINDEHIHVAKWKAWYERHFRAPETMGDEEWAEKWRDLELAGIGDKGIHQKLSALASASYFTVPAWEDTQDFLNAYYMNHISPDDVVEGFEDFVKSLDSDDGLVFLSNAPRALVDVQCNILGVPPGKDTGMSIATEDMPAGIRKPMTEAYILARRQGMMEWGQFKHCLAIDNMPNMIAGARGAGFNVAIINAAQEDVEGVVGLSIYPNWHSFVANPPRLSAAPPLPGQP